MSCIKSCISTELLHDVEMKYRRLLLNVVGLVALMTMFDSPNVLSFECQVDGHGPYDLNRKKCFQLGRQQAKTNCVLKEKQAEIELRFSDQRKTAKNLETAICRSQPKKPEKNSSNLDCTQAICQNSPDTAQH